MAASSIPSLVEHGFEEDSGDDLVDEEGAESGWAVALKSCDHLDSLSSDLAHIPSPATLCNRCEHPRENWLCLCCKDVLCSRFVNKHMLQHFQQTGHCLALGYSDLSFWCFSCNSYLDAPAIPKLWLVHETAHVMKFGVAPPLRTVENSNVQDAGAESGSSGS